MVTQAPIILLVDDDLDTLDLLHRLLVTFTHRTEIVAVASGAAALAVTAERPVALVLADYLMPEMNGMQLTSAIKATSPTTRVAIISVADMDEVGQQAKAVGADDVLAKPFVLAQLEDLIAESIPLPESDDE
jgi:CheY-like chemotaxis protein